MIGRSGKNLKPVALALALSVMLAGQMLPIGLNVSQAAGTDQGLELSFNNAPARQAADKTEAVYTLQQLDDSDKDAGDSGPTSASQPLQGTVTSIHVTKGRSQIVKFAQPIVRMSIAEPTVADLVPLSPDQVMINGKLRGVTSLIVWDENGQEGIFDLYVQNDTSEVLDAVKAVAPNEKIQMRITDDTFVLTGQVSSSVVLDQIRQIAAAYGYRSNPAKPEEDKFKDLTDTPVPQVQLEVRVAEANRSIGRILKTSFQWNNGDLNITRLANPLDGKLLENVKRATSSLNPSQFGPISNTQASTNSGGVTGAFRWFDGPLNTMWDMLETSGKINTLANPTLVCTHGRTASFLAGGEFPFRSGTDNSGQPIISFKEFGVKLNFTPWISVKSGRIEMKVNPEVSSPDSSRCVVGAGGDQVCGVSKRATDTTVQLNDGETLMISGILSRSEANNFNKIPFVGNMPVLGNLFKNGDLSKNESELVVIITPHIVKTTDYGKILGAAQ